MFTHEKEMKGKLPVEMVEKEHTKCKNNFVEMCENIKK
jgi:hypothetical protein